VTPALPFLEQEASAAKPRQPEIIRVHTHIRGEEIHHLADLYSNGRVLGYSL